MNVRIGTKTSVSIPNSFFDQIGERFASVFKTRIKDNQEKIQEAFFKEIYKALLKNNIYRELVSDSFISGRSLRAELGLTKALAKQASVEILGVIREHLPKALVTKRGSARNSYVELDLGFPNPDDIREGLLDMDSASYISKGKTSTEIFWMEWLLDGATQPIDKFGRNWAITYDLDGLGGRSRSKRALMVLEPKKVNAYRGKGKRKTDAELAVQNAKYEERLARFKQYGPYKLPLKYVNLGQGEHFIDQIFYSNVFIKDLKRNMSALIRTLIFDL